MGVCTTSWWENGCSLCETRKMWHGSTNSSNNYDKKWSAIKQQSVPLVNRRSGVSVFYTKTRRVRMTSGESSQVQVCTCLIGENFSKLNALSERWFADDIVLSKNSVKTQTGRKINYSGREWPRWARNANSWKCELVEMRERCWLVMKLMRNFGRRILTLRVIYWTEL